MVPDPALQDVHVIGPVEIDPVFVMFPDPALNEVHVIPVAVSVPVSTSEVHERLPNCPAPVV